MSYKKENQSLEPSLIKILEGIKDFNEASSNRIEDLNEWEDTHILELSDIKQQLIPLEIVLRKLKEKTW